MNIIDEWSSLSKTERDEVVEELMGLSTEDDKVCDCLDKGGIVLEDLLRIIDVNDVGDVLCRLNIDYKIVIKKI